jgi:predicted CXXCH cytochrome family protein
MALVFIVGILSAKAQHKRVEGALLDGVKADGGYSVPTPIEALRLLQEDNERHARVKSGQEFFKGATYVGSKNCAGCHQKRYEEWQSTWHAKMEQWPTAQTVVGDFDGATVTYKDIKALDLKGNEIPGKAITYQIRTHSADGKFYFTVLDGNSGANNQTFEIAKTLGGKWDQHYEVRVGDSLAVAPIRFAVGTKEWITSAFRPNEWVLWEGDGWRPRAQSELMPSRFAEAKCTGCHTTGFEFVKDKRGHWSVTGKGELGVACEHCHGPGSKHVEEANTAKAQGKALISGTSTIVHPLKDLSFQQQNQMCGKCHGRQASRDHADQAFQQNFLVGDTDLQHKARFWGWNSQSKVEQGYFWPNDWAKRNRQQWQDYQKSKHFAKAGLTCVTCHAFHGQVEEGQLRQKPAEMCAGCHDKGGSAARNNVEFYAGSKMQQAGVQCIDCHMPKSAFRTNSTSKFPRQWHGTLHTFQVATPALELQHGIRSSCTACHVDPPSMPGGPARAHLTKEPPFSPVADLDRTLTGRQGNIRARLARLQVMLGHVNVSRAAAVRDAARAKANVDRVVADGSYGFHNMPKATRLLRQAHILARRARGSVVVVAAAGMATGGLTTGGLTTGGLTTGSLTGALQGPWSTHEVEPGDTLASISLKYYGSEKYHSQIYRDNSDVIGNPETLQPRMQLKLPSLDDMRSKAERAYVANK